MAGSPPVIEPPSFLDVSLHGWYSKGIAWSAQNYIMGGYGGDRFGPDDPLTREQLATALWRYAGSPEAGAEGDFADEADLSPLGRPGGGLGGGTRLGRASGRKPV